MNKTGIKLQKVIDKNAKLLNMKLLKRCCGQAFL